MKEIFIIEDEIVVAKGIENILLHNGYEISGIATNYKLARQKLLTINPDLILCDINLSSEKTGIDLMKEIEPSRDIPFIFITAYSDLNTIKKATKLAPCNYITKPFNDKQLLTCVQRVFLEREPSATDTPTERELTIIKLVARGYSTKQIADILNISFNTVESHRKNLIKKFSVKSMAELICMATSNGWIEYKQS